ncbi:acyl-CoA dehydrogenase family protein [Streptomyces sp. NBC_01190]|uniref:acyl-CoA dehydrogenase family protein n=1 Tax=Streptomyces sp. NBC_01190 TaxID=2903767 RepID=UPI0038674CFB|nr:acyl-CoA dehydrogenase family protein [Streptomyces sp. NBC_01190]
MRDTLVACEAAAHDGGFTPGLELALRTVDTAPPGRVAAYPAGRVPAGTEVVPHRLAELEGVAFVAWPHPPAESAAPAPYDKPDDRRTVFAALLGAVRVGVSRRLLDDAVAHLSGRVGGGEPLIRKQLVLGTVADVITALDAVRQLLLVAHRVPAAVADAHDRITALDWDTAKLLGASGYLADGPVRAAYVGRLAADCWTDREDVQP